ncbi:LacI family DNA-binding transcriptional regulator [Lederbergia lenta]|uniref:Transcriptional regulator n=1 Tax=Lederbergia lenta TaxID=1467 RepID=A0A2X4VL15_LEDLE|nr:LacI family DNA-binding transcriptional regulator [Lederbergia lenta]MCM3112628.1 LacI family transcriptional regulator [Lederbergia lenta]MEC2323666.1 LacI family DNA-binding transcriptional regulator [Lederbergia lenta]SQI51673.1 transcriptional regulator [Lederbergia lenta]
MTITIKDIATAVGVSYSTVSKALNDSPLVKQETKAKIIKIAKDLGYEPNFAAQRLVKKESKLIGLAWPTLDRMAHSVLATKINEEFTKNGYSMILSINSIQTSLDIFKRYQADGVIIFDEESTKTVHALTTIPIVSYGVGKGKDFPIVDVNYQKAMYAAVEYLAKLGHEKIAFIGDFSPIDDRQIEKYRGFQNAMQHFELSFSGDNLINTAGLSWYDGYIAAKRLLQSAFIPTAIIGTSYDISAGIVRAIREANFIIPKDISVVSYDNIPQMGNMEIPLTSVGVPVDVMAKQIVQTILRAIQNRQDVPLIQTLDPQLTERNSCAHVRNI